MRTIEGKELVDYFSDVEDPRQDQGKRHLLKDIVCIAIFGFIGDCNDYRDIEAYGKSKREWLGSILDLPFGIPSHGTFRRVFGALEPEIWQGRFKQWVQTLELADLTEDEELKDEILAFDGKTSCASRSEDIKALHTVSVWSSKHGIVIGQQQVDEHSNEITALPRLIESVDISGAIVSTDAMGTQTQVAWAIREHQGDYMLALKANHPKLYEDTVWLFEHAQTIGWNNVEHDYFESFDKAHGREEHRKYWTISDLSTIDKEVVASWRDLKTLCCVESTRTSKGKTSVEKRYYISSIDSDAKRAAHAIRNHWSVENNLHWVLDVTFDEDRSTVHLGHGQANLVTLRHIALNLLKLDTSSKDSIKVKRKRAGWDNDYLLSLLV